MRAIKETVVTDIENRTLAFKILDYFRRHPQAKDSVEGIARWWVNEDPVEVRRVLDQLVDKNLVAKRRNANFDLYFDPSNTGLAEG